MSTYQRLFGAGPRGVLISIVLFVLAWKFETIGELPAITANRYARWAIFALSVSGTVILLAWSVKSLPPGARGKQLTSTGAYRYFRHPIYASFLTCFNFGLAVLLNNWIYMAWAVLVHIMWHWIVGTEEALMRRGFPGEYEEYCKRTGRFIPKLSRF